jgi:hypothetical protein
LGRFIIEPGTTPIALKRKGETTYVNEREVALAEYIFDELNEQVGEWKKSTASGRVGGATRTFAMLISHGTLPVAFITFYAGQKRQFNSKAFAGASNTTEKRWEHLNIRVDTVDRFQGCGKPDCHRKHGPLCTNR